MTNEEFRPQNLRVGDWLTIPYHTEWKICVLEVLDNKLRVSSMPCALFFGEYWPIKLNQETIENAGLSGVVEQMEAEGIEHKYVHQVQHFIADNNIDKEITNSMIKTN